MSRPRRGDIWWVALDPTIGSEIQKTRPCIVVGTDALERLPLRIVIPLTKRKQKHAYEPWSVLIPPDNQNGLTAASVANTVQVRCVSLNRFQRRMGTVHSRILLEVLGGLALCLDLAIVCGEQGPVANT